MKRQTTDGSVIISPLGTVVGIGTDVSNAWHDATNRLSGVTHWKDLQRDGYRSADARITVTFESPK